MSVVVTLEPVSLEIEPGTSRDVTVKVRNTGEIVDQYTVTVLGQPAQWASVTPPVVNVYTGAEETVRLSFAPPRASNPEAGTYEFGVYVQSSQNPSDGRTEQGIVTVLPFYATTAQLVPQTSRGSGRVRHTVTVKNGGDAPVDVAIGPSDPNQLLAFEVSPNRLALRPGASASSRLQVTPGDTFLTGPQQNKPFVVTIESTGQLPFDIAGALLQSARLPSWLPRAAAAIGAMAIIGAVLFGTGILPPKPPATPTPSDFAQASTPPPTQSPLTTPTATDTPATPTPAASAPASEAPTPTPLPSFQVDHPETEFVTSNFDSVCELDCDALAISGLRVLATSLQAPYDGNGTIVTSDQLSPQSMPFVLEADRPFKWETTSGQSGETQKVVVDFRPLADDPAGQPYAAFYDDTGTPRRFVVQSGLGGQIVAALYKPKLSMPLPTFDPGFWDDLNLDLIDPPVIR